MAAIGTKRTSACALNMSAFDPKRIWAPPPLLLNPIPVLNFGVANENKFGTSSRTGADCSGSERWLHCTCPLMTQSGHPLSDKTRAARRRHDFCFAVRAMASFVPPLLL